MVLLVIPKTLLALLHATTQFPNPSEPKPYLNLLFPSVGRAKTVEQRPLLSREVETRLPDCGVTH